jgi:hypothetical protein
MASKTPHNWKKLHTEFISCDVTRAQFFRKKGIAKSTWLRWAIPQWDLDQAAHRAKVAQRAEQKIIEKQAETTAQILQRHAEMGKAAATLGFQNLFVEEVDEKGEKTGNKVLRPDLHASDMVRLTQLGLMAEYRAVGALKAMTDAPPPPGVNTDPTGTAPIDVDPREEVEALRKIMENPEVLKHAEAMLEAMIKGEKR